MILCIKRDQHVSTKFQKDFGSLQFSKDISLSQFTMNEEKSTYSLKGFSHLKGKTIFKGHYVTHILCKDNQQWIRYDNEIKTKINYDTDIMNNQIIQKNICLLMFEKNDNVQFIDDDNVDIININSYLSYTYEVEKKKN